MKEWYVEGPHGNIWIPAFNGDDACERYQVRFGLESYEINLLVVSDVRDPVPA